MTPLEILTDPAADISTIGDTSTPSSLPQSIRVESTTVTQGTNKVPTATIQEGLPSVHLESYRKAHLVPFKGAWENPLTIQFAHIRHSQQAHPLDDSD